ncbi:MAG: hypothetical protein SVW57_05760 [Thermodesulfobacteriota bacterium]|nr:hypothetical protein [Thermodesulfobacteriota bacterium]
MTPHILLQTLVAPVIASIIILLTRNKLGKQAGWITCITLIYAL